MTALRQVTDPAHLPVSLAEAKAHLRVDHDDEDNLITGLIEAATQHLDGWTGILGQALVEREMELALDWFPPGQMALPFGPAAEILSIKYIDLDGVEQTLGLGAYETDVISHNARIQPVDAWPETKDVMHAVKIRWTAGYALAAVPHPIKQAIMMMVAHLYENREAVAKPLAELPLGVRALIAPYRRQMI